MGMDEIFFMTGMKHKENSAKSIVGSLRKLKVLSRKQKVAGVYAMDSYFWKKMEKCPDTVRSGEHVLVLIKPRPYFQRSLSKRNKLKQLSILRVLFFQCKSYFVNKPPNVEIKIGSQLL
eukprot:TRINITY_DN7697_c0_g1_i1.p2 TRINITY_DN7697_c0_g1~~TRINITY_DN7697_c0_g1_i1.p2  ORF type:complete len:119 (+),score=12.30 TRINITY_DN7697_c0_g1_i1:199-555(+)